MLPRLSRAALPAAVELRPIEQADVGVFFEQQRDAAANWMAGFGSAEPDNRTAFFARWHRILGDATIVGRTILAREHVAGHVLCFGPSAEREICYWLGREHWRQGIATRALSQFLGVVPERPLFARAVRDNLGSLRVLEKCGFVQYATDSGYSLARGCDVEELVVRLV